jgi:hypothetical protein
MAQQKGLVSGVVKDAETGETLIGVAVYERQLKVGATTDEKGNYQLELPLGSHSLQFSYIGYQTVTKTVTVGHNPKVLDVKTATGCHQAFRSGSYQPKRRTVMCQRWR